MKLEDVPVAVSLVYPPRRWTISCIAGWLLICAASVPLRADEDAPNSAVLTASSDFAGGSAVIEAIDQSQRVIRLRPAKHEDRGWVCWWYVKLTGIKSGETLTLDVGGGVWATPDRAHYSTDGKSWLQTEAGQRIGDRIVYKQQVDATTVWFAWGPPLVLDDAELLVQQAARHKFAKAIELCTSRDGHSVPAVEIRQEGARDADRYGIWIQARQHAWESGGSWVCRGFLEWLVSNDARAESLRKRSLVTVVPVMDVDNVQRGAGGKDEKPQDHNRDWSDAPHHPAVRAAIARIREQEAQGRFDLFVDLHNPGPSTQNPFYYIAPRSSLSPLGKRNLDAFLSASREELTGPLEFRGQVIESGPRYDQNWQRISKNWVTQHTRPHVVAVTLETAWNTARSTPENYRRVGADLGRAIERYLRGSVRPDQDDGRSERD